MHSRLWLSDARGESSPRAGSHYLEFFYALKLSAAVEAKEKAEGRSYTPCFLEFRRRAA
jgi:hypothetical protein